jgi:RNA polymerase sigma factor (sigma-70 family)
MRLTDEQSARAATLYPYAIRMSRNRAARMGEYGRFMLGKYVDVATDEVVRCAATHEGINGASYKSYAARTIQLSLRSADRRRDPRNPMPIEFFEPSIGPSRELESDESFESIVGLLDDRARRVLTLHYRHGLTSPEIADRVGLTTSGVETVRRRALISLRARLPRILGPDGSTPVTEEQR